MNVGWVGLGKLGLTCAAVLADRGHDVVGYDIADWPARVLTGEAEPPREDGWDRLDLSRLKLASSAAEVVAVSDVVFVAVQTPHDARYGGEQPMPGDPVDFEYGYLTQAVREVAQAAGRYGKHLTLVVVSTVLPGTTRAHLAPLCGPTVKLVYSPAFIAMGTTIRDWTNPEFVLAGADNPGDVEPLAAVHASLHDRPVLHVSIESAELVKVAYNTYISMKIVFANTVMEICHKTGADCDQVTHVLAQATDRIVSAAYLRGGMGDGGGCHPRDNMAMSWLAQRLDLSTDLMGYVSRAREQQSAWLASMAEHWSDLSGRPIVILGKAYKPESPLTNGSPALLLASQLAHRDHAKIWDPHVDGDAYPFHGPRVFVVATRHPEFAEFPYPVGSVVLDPWGFVPDRSGVTVIRVGRKR